ncbi:8482_t:CDS:1, partial [Funneliformis geosporum]
MLILKDNNNGIIYFQKAANDYPVAQLYLGRCYEKGNDLHLAFYWYKKAVENVIIYAQSNL